MEDECDLSNGVNPNLDWNGAIFNDRKQPLTQFSRSRYSLTLNIS